MEVLNRKNFGARARPRGPVVEIFDIFKFFPLIFFPFFLFFFLFFCRGRRPRKILAKKVGIFGILVCKMSKIVTFSGILGNPLVSTHPRPNPNPNPNPNPSPPHALL